jgi:predicted HAD superfamily Cof-like phosphohydrolase
MKSSYEKVRDFTRAAEIECPKEPTPMSKESVKFLIGMVLSELQELALTVTNNTEEATLMLYQSIGVDPHEHKPIENVEERIAEQADAMVDAWYYMLNSAAQHSIDLSKVFDLVHNANMNKCDPKTGKFIRRKSDGKILKPEGWQAPDIVAEIKRQRNN